MYEFPTEKRSSNNQEVANEEKSFAILFGLFSNQLAHKPAILWPYL
jgi:hypothetical protein